MKVEVWFEGVLVLERWGKTVKDATQDAWNFCFFKGYDVDSMEFRPV